MIPDINENVDAVRRGDQSVALRHHIGGTVYVSVTSGYSCVEIRRLYQPFDDKDGEIKPTKKGVALKFAEWSYLCSLIDIIHTAFSALATALPCYYDEDHMSQVNWLSCLECNPFMNQQPTPTA